MKFQGFLAAQGPGYKYSLEVTLAEFFTLTSIKRETCDAAAIDLAQGRVVPVAVQGNCSYCVYAGPAHEYVVQFRPKSLRLRIEMIRLARRVHGSIVPNTAFHGQLRSDREHPLRRFLCMLYLESKVSAT